MYSCVRLRKMNWLRVWRGVAENNLVTLLSTSLADQDVINAVISRQEGMVYRLPCSWNIQLSDNSLSDSLCLDTSKVCRMYTERPIELPSVHEVVTHLI